MRLQPFYLIFTQAFIETIRKAKSK